MRVEIENGKFYVIISVSEGVSIAKEISRDEVSKLVQQLKTALINTNPGE